MKSFLKFGGLAFSAGLTLSLFIRLFGAGAFGLTMAAAALCLFELGAAGWAHLLLTARDGQRAVARVCLAVTVGLSLLSSCTEIVLATNLGASAFALLDLEFVTLAMIAAALSCNVVGALAFEYTTPETVNKSRELERQARARRAAHDLEDKVTELALTRAEAEVEGVAGEVAGRLAVGLRESIVSRLLAAELRRDVPTLAAPMFDTATAPTVKAVKPTTKPTRADAVPEYADALPVVAVSKNGNGTHPKA